MDSNSVRKATTTLSDLSVQEEDGSPRGREDRARVRFAVGEPHAVDVGSALVDPDSVGLQFQAKVISQVVLDR